MKKYLLLPLLLLVAIFGWWYWQKDDKISEVNLPEPIEYQAFINTTSTETNNVAVPADNEVVVEEKPEVKPEEKPIVKPIADSINLAVPFTSQAPTGDWSEPWQNACEEASFLMVDYYYQDKTFPAPAIVEQTLADMVDWQIKNWGDHHDLPIAELTQYIEQNFAYDTEILANLTPDLLREYLQKGQPIIIPADGRILNNPNFTGEGPEYHMLVVKGYINNNFITNDPGTRNGADYVYTSQNLFDAIADFIPGRGTVGSAIGLIVYPR